jgi:hypothetical protein
MMATYMDLDAHAGNLGSRVGWVAYPHQMLDMVPLQLLHARHRRSMYEPWVAVWGWASAGGR